MTVDLERPLRYPDQEEAPLMSKRARWLVILGFLLPGSAQALSGNRKLGRFGLSATILLIVFAVVSLAALLFARVAALTFFTNTWVLLGLQILLIGYAVLWLVLGFDTLRLTRLVAVPMGWRVPIAILSIVLTVLPSAGAAWAASTINAGRSLVGDLFSEAPAVEPVDGRYNILLLGTDAGDDREGIRPDSISLVSIDAETGQSAIVGLPRELVGMPFPEGSPMRDVHPNGFCVGPNAFGEYGGCLTSYLNGVYAELEQADVIVESEGLPAEYAAFYDGFYADAAANGSSPGLEATKDAVSGATGLEVQFYVLVNMDAFSDIIDALGGVEIDVQERLPIGGDQYQNNVDGWIEPGMQTLDGYTAQWYARSRYGSTNGDFDRMARQRELQSAILAQMNPQNVLLRFQEISAAGSEVVRTDIPESMLGRFVDLATKAKGHEPVDVELVPPTVDPEYPDYALIAQLVADGIAQATPADEDAAE